MGNSVRAFVATLPREFILVYDCHPYSEFFGKATEGAPSSAELVLVLGFRSSTSFQKSSIFKNDRLSDGSTRSETQKNKNMDLCVFFLLKESLELTVIFYQKRIEANLEA